MRWYVCAETFWIDGISQMVRKGQVFAVDHWGDLPMPAPPPNRTVNHANKWKDFWKELEVVRKTPL